MSKGLRSTIYGFASLLAIGAFSIAGLTSTANASEITNNAYKKEILAACSKYDNDRNPDVPHACLYGGLGEAGLRYFPQNLESCKVRQDFSNAEQKACEDGAKAGAKSFEKHFSNFSRDGFVTDSEKACAPLAGNADHYQLCLAAAHGPSDSPFPYSPDVCAARHQDAEQEACNQGVAAGNLLMEQFVALGIQPAVMESTGQTPGSPVVGGGGVTPREPVGVDEFGNPVYSDPTKNNPGTGGSSGSGGSGGGTVPGDSTDNVDIPGVNEGKNPGGGSGGGGGSGSGGTGGGGSEDSGGSTGGSQDSGGSSGSGGSTGGSGSGGSTGGREVPDSPHYRPENKGLGMNGPDSSLPNAPVGFSEAFYTNGNGDKMKITVHRPDNHSSRPGIVFVHGGGWRADGGTWNTDFMTQDDPRGPAQNGYVSFRIQYRLMPNGLYYIYHDVRNALEYVQNNAAKFGLDPNRVAMWGDSAGGSLTARVAASGNSGLAAAVTMSGPMNAFRDMTWSIPTLAIGLDHTTCIDTGFTSGFGAINNYIGLGTTPEAIISSIQNMSPMEQLQLAGQVAADIQGIEQGFKNYDWEGELAQWGINADDIAEYTTKVPIASTEMETIQQTYTVDKLTAETSSDLNSPSQKLRGELTSVVQSFGNDLIGMSSPVGGIANSINNLVNSIPTSAGQLDAATAQSVVSEVNNITAELNRMTTELENPNGNGPSAGLRGIVTDMQNNRAVNPEHFRSVANLQGSNGSLQLIAASSLPAEQKQALGYASVALEVIAEHGNQDSSFNQVASAVVNSSDVGSLIANLAGVAAGHMQNSHAAVLTSKLGKCLDDAIQLTPAIFASPSTPPMFMANAQSEILVPPYDATEMQSKLRSFGTRAESFIIPGDLHMGYDARAIDPAFNFLNGVLHPAPLNSDGGNSTFPVP